MFHVPRDNGSGVEFGGFICPACNHLSYRALTTEPEITELQRRVGSKLTDEQRENYTGDAKPTI